MNVYLRRNIRKDGKVERFIEEICEIDEKGSKNTIYLRKDNKHMFFPIREELLQHLKFEGDSLFEKTFIKRK